MNFSEYISAGYKSMELLMEKWQKWVVVGKCHDSEMDVGGYTNRFGEFTYKERG